MNIQSYTILHYGKDYLPYALKSIYPAMDKMHIFYTPHPSHGRQANNVQPPESMSELRDAAFEYDPHRKIQFNIVDRFYQEGNHRDYALSVCKANGADLVVVLDYDEVWHAEVLSNMLAHVKQRNHVEPKIRNWLINFTHLWKSFNWCCKDEGWPVRIIDLRADEGTAYLPKEYGGIYHFGYAISDKLMRYKWKIHGHYNELRPGWLDGKWQECPAADCHPTNERNFWDCKPFDKKELPPVMRTHPFYNLDRID